MLFGSCFAAKFCEPLDNFLRGNSRIHAFAHWSSFAQYNCFFKDVLVNFHFHSHKVSYVTRSRFIPLSLACMLSGMVCLFSIKHFKISFKVSTRDLNDITQKHTFWIFLWRSVISSLWKVKHYLINKWNIFSF